MPALNKTALSSPFCSKCMFVLCGMKKASPEVIGKVSSDLRQMLPCRHNIIDGPSDGAMINSLPFCNSYSLSSKSEKIKVFTDMSMIKEFLTDNRYTFVEEFYDADQGELTFENN